MSDASYRRINFYRDLNPQLLSFQKSQESAALIFQAFASFNSSQVESGNACSEVRDPLKYLLSFCDTKQLASTGAVVAREIESLRVYARILEHYSADLPAEDDKAQFPTFRVEGDCQMVKLISDNYQAESISRERVSAMGFRLWVSGLALSNSGPRDSQLLLSRRQKVNQLISYRQFTSDSELAVNFIHDLLVHSNDPFLAREVSFICSKAAKLLSISNLDELVRRWFLSTVDVPRDILSKGSKSPMIQYMQSFHRAPSHEDQRGDFLCELVYYGLQKGDIRFDKLCQSASTVLSVPGIELQDIEDGSWLYLLAHTVAFRDDPDVYTAVVTRMFDEQHYGQFGINLLNPVMGLFEGGFHPKFDKDEHVPLFQLLHTLTCLYLHERGRNLGLQRLLDSYHSLSRTACSLSMFPELTFAILERVFHGPIVSMMKTGEGDDSFLDVAMSFLDFASARTDSGNRIFGHYRDAIAVLKYRTHIRFDDLRFDESEFEGFFSRSAPVVVDRERLLRVLTDSIINDDANCSDLLNRLGITKIVYENVVKRLLVHCWDADIDAYLVNLDRGAIHSIFVEAVRMRLSVIVQSLCEDTSRMHGLMVALVSTNEELRHLLKLSTDHDEYVREWLVSESSACMQILDSCHRLLFHPLLKGDKETDSLITCLRSIKMALTGIS
jgi:hypothetical protein